MTVSTTSEQHGRGMVGVGVPNIHLIISWTKRDKSMPILWHNKEDKKMIGEVPQGRVIKGNNIKKTNETK